MNNINIHELQAQISSIMRKVEKGESYQVMRYSEPVAILLPIPAHDELKGECKTCLEHWRKVTGKKLDRAADKPKKK